MKSAFDASNNGEGFVFVNWAQQVRVISHSFRYSHPVLLISLNTEHY